MSSDVSCTNAPALLERLIDGELSDAESDSVHEHLATCEACTKQFESQTALNRLLGEGLVRYTAPDVLKARIRSAITQAADTGRERQQRSLRRQWPLVAAGIAIVALTNAATFSFTQASLGRRAVAQEVLASHVRSLMPGHLVDVPSTDQHNVKPWFNGRTALSPPVPSLESQDFHLVGGRLDYVAGRPAAVVVYSRRLHSINVFAWPDQGPNTQESSRSDQGYHFISWRANNIAFWVVSDLNAGELATFARAYREADLRK